MGNSTYGKVRAHMGNSTYGKVIAHMGNSTYGKVRALSHMCYFKSEHFPICAISGCQTFPYVLFHLTFPYVLFPICAISFFFNLRVFIKE